MHRPSIQISSREAFLKAAKHPRSSPVRIARTWTTVTIQEGERWFERPAIRLFYEIDVEAKEGPMTWTYAEVVRLDEDGRLTGPSLQALLQAERVRSEIMRSQSGSL